MSTAERRWVRVFTPADLGRFLAELRVERAFTQEELAETLGISRRYLYEIESGKPSLYTERLFALLRVLGIRVILEAEVVGADDRGGDAQDAAGST